MPGALVSLLLSGHAPLLEALTHERPSAPREIAGLVLGCVQHAAAALAAAGTYDPADARWRHVAPNAFSMLNAPLLQPHAHAYMRAQEGPVLLRAMLGVLRVLPRRASPGQDPSHHVALQCLAACAALELAAAAYGPDGNPPAGLPAVDGLLLWCEVLAAATTALSAATERGAEALQANARLSADFTPREAWELALRAWADAHVQTRECSAPLRSALLCWQGRACLLCRPAVGPPIA